MRKFFALFISFVLVFLALKTNAFTLYWFTGAGIRKPALEIAHLYNSTHKNKVVVISGGSGAVLNEMLQSKKGDIYTLVDAVFLERAIKHGIVLKYRKILKLTPIFAINPKDRGKIKSIYDLAKNNVRIAGGNPHTFCLGLTFKEILKKMPPSLSSKIEKNINVRCMNVLQIIGYVKSGAVDAGIVLDKALIGSRLPYIKIPKKYNVHRFGFIALISYSKHPEVAEEVYDFILNHLYVYKLFGFQVLRR